ncbi:flippase [Oscillatoria sp. HE19RPO]|uniref:flippase n=1 Tax=Oscillatoria sp. HE19RPO TaxID=2954806 RepID=UPI0020C42BE1|nr:flippase [Oscillatoria sp. HE19RPO]
MTPNLLKILSNTSWLFADRLLRLFLGMTVGVWVARYLGPEKFGVYNYALAFVALFSPLAQLGLDKIVVRDIVRDPSCADETLGTAFILKLMGGFVTLLLTVGLISWLRPDDKFTCFLVAILAGGTIVQPFQTIDFWFESQVKSKYTVYAKSSTYIVTNCLKILLIYFKASLIAFAFTNLLDVTLSALGSGIAYYSQGHNFKNWHISLKRCIKLFQDSWPLVISGVMIMIYMRIDQIMLGQIAGNEEVGIYSVAVRLAELWYLIPTAIVSSTFPSIVEAKKISEEVFYKRLQKLYNLMAFSAYAIAIIVTFSSSWIITALFGEVYHRSIPILLVLIWSLLFTNLGIARSSFLTTMDLTKLHLMTVFWGMLINVTLNAYLIPLYGGMGAAIASSIAYCFATYGACFLCKPLLKTGYMLSKAIIYPQIW